MCPLQKDQQLRWSVSPSGSKMNSLKHVFNLLQTSGFGWSKVSMAIIFLRNWTRHDWSENCVFFCRVNSKPFITRRKYGERNAVELIQFCYSRIITDTYNLSLKGTWIRASAEVSLLVSPPAPSQKSPGRGLTAFPSPAKSKWSTRTRC